MPDASPAQRERFGRWSLLGLAIGISILFFFLVQDFLITLLLAAIFSSMMQPAYQWLLEKFKGRKGLASLTTVFIVLLGIILPLSAFLGVVVSQAIQVSESVGPWVEQRLDSPGDPIDQLLERIPFADRVQPYRTQIEAKVGELAGQLGTFLVNRVAALTRGTVSFLLQLFVMLYAMFFFLTGGRKILMRILYYLPLTPERESRMVNHFVSVTRATIKGTLIIGLVQGTLAGVAFFIAGIQGSAFWGTIMGVLAVIPGIGPPLVWVPAVVYLLATGQFLAALLLGLWCGLVVGLSDNLLRPRLVGRDAKMSDLMILVSTLGGLFLFGAVGFIIGPIIAALFVTVWEIYGAVFHDVLPDNA
jgi:predicted PurR-regulated permease PerM